MSKTPELAAVEFGPIDLRTLEEIVTQLGACRVASEQKSGPKQSAGAQVLTVFLRMVEDRLSNFVKELKAKMTVKTATA